jgi:GAF domain-containing protein
VVDRDPPENISGQIAAGLRVESCAISLCGRPVDGSDPVAADLEDWQFVLGEGPSFTAFRTGQRVEYPNPAALAAEYLGLADHMYAAGIASVASFPIAIENKVLGAITIYQSSPRRLRSWQRRRAERSTRTVAAAIRSDVIGWAARRRLVTSEFELATGYLIANSALNADEAAIVIRARAYASGTPLREACRRILDGDQSVLTVDAP